MEPAVTLIVSDLHLGAEASLDDFYADEEFASFLEHHSSGYESVRLVINGDWIDFLQIDPYPEKRARRDDLEEVYPLRMTEDQAVAALERTIARHAPFFAALRTFVTKNPVTILRGNHDIELAFPAVQERIRVALAPPRPELLVFPPVCHWNHQTGLYVEHGCQVDPVNAFVRFEDPFLDRGRRKLETPFGSVIVKTFWNRVEGEFPFIDKIRPMSDSIAAIVVGRPTYLLLRFDYFVDLVLGSWAENIRSLVARRPPKAIPPPEGTPEAVSRAQWRRYEVGRLTALITLAILAHLVFQGLTLFTTTAHLGATRALSLLWLTFERFVTHVALAAAAIVGARILRLILWKAKVRAIVRVVVYRLMVLAGAVLFFEAAIRMYWLPLVVAVGAYLVWDGKRTLLGRPIAREETVPAKRAVPEVDAALRILRESGARTVVFGHTHIPIQLTLEDGKRFINSGTWVKVVDIRNVREAPTELNTYVFVDAQGQAQLMSWRGSEPARRYVSHGAEGAGA